MVFHGFTKYLLITFCLLSGLTLLISAFFMQDNGIATGFIGYIAMIPSIYAISLLVQNKKLGKFFLSWVIFIGLVAFVGTAIYLFAHIEDVHGKTCTGFFGVKEACTESAVFGLYVLFYNMYSVIAVTIFSAVAVFAQAMRK